MPTFSSRDIPDLHGQVIIVTGGNAGLGYETIRQLDKNNPAMTQLNQENPGHTEIRFLQLDLASFESVKAAADFLRQETRLDILINNAGIMMTPEDVTTDGYETQLGINVLGPALFTQLLLPTLRKMAEVNSQTRMVMLSSAAHAKAPSDLYNFDEHRTNAANRRTTQRYTTSKLANLHYARALAERETKVKIISVHPGMVATNLHHSSTGIFPRPFLHAAVHFAATPHGQYYGPIGKTENGSKLIRDDDLQERMFRWIQAELSPHVGTIM
ncbi:short chain dehydrogenase [Aspergillus piperis CBS 112811]|uniref:Short chain dehydrogenase n=1 Tax=Aspergillus piperis CBS 112811 TaxID=1448313 RepID=A0A8G1R1W0_9EURO|nr:short chain dehydrogenase [Aspergillus piperis CBS 112811]RAH57723.1 short chain dehydrogenase [Aspergillus piperis CBS 112811]